MGPVSDRPTREACAASWVQNGLRPRSLNAPQELDQIPTLAGVSSEPFVQENPVVAPDHPGPSLGNIFDVVAPDEPCAITNADVYLLKVSGLPSLIRDLTRDALLVARRTDVTGLLGSAQGIFTTGIDFVAFRPDTVMPVMEDPGIRQFQLGVTWWDYVFPIAASFLVPVRRLREPFLIHHAHEAYWNNQQYETIRKQAKAVVASFAQRQSAKSEVAREFLRRLALTETAGSEHEVDVGFSILCIEWLFGSLGPVQEIELPLDRDDAVFSALVSSGPGGRRQKRGCSAALAAKLHWQRTELAFFRFAFAVQTSPHVARKSNDKVGTTDTFRKDADVPGNPRLQYP